MNQHELAIEEMLAKDFGTIPELIRAHARFRPEHPAFIQDGISLSYRALDQRMDQVAAALQRDGVKATEAIAICAYTSIEYAVVFLGSLRAGVTVAPLAPSSSAESLVAMMTDAGAKKLFLDQTVAELLAPVGSQINIPGIRIDAADGNSSELDAWLAEGSAAFSPVDIQPGWAFNTIYSSGTTGTPKGIMQPNFMRWGHVQRGAAHGYGLNAVTLLSTPLYSNTTLVSFFATLALGGTVLLMAKFEANAYLALAEKYQATHTMLVPVQYQRLMAVADFDSYDLSSFHMKFCTSAPFSAVLKADILKRWPGGLIEYYGMTEGGVSCILVAHEHPDKLHTVGVALPGGEIRLIDEQGKEVAAGEPGEIVGYSPSMMTGYHNQPAKTREAEWYDPSGRRFIRSGDLGRFDSDGFLLLFDRKKDMVISGGFNIYPSDLEAVLRQHPQVADAAVVGVPSERWGETPVAFVVAKNDATPVAEDLLAWANERLGKMQRLSAMELVDVLPRSAIGKVLKRELRDAYRGTVA
ncbi:class I adenylate-forming enzyme family protein [Undibacterium terreum]|uniref:4-coumarate--CoA ligase n=1 Tax=Undibacterium terreum TaxID=1224302 RepID=A0A916XG21_9BURK|nr:class I adenylate-forming enzyme family protein [Undibacterium terreum]GGC69472.1 4-coumarate--CoA ligase [Undibacterium terreum]